MVSPDRTYQPRVRSTATALPPYRIEQDDMARMAKMAFGRDLPDKYMRFFHSSGVQTRYTALSLDHIFAERMAGEKNDLYIRLASDLAEQAATRAMDKAGIDPVDISSLHVCTVTGDMHPSLDLELQSRLGLRSQNLESQVDTGHGCAAGADALAAAAFRARHLPGSYALVVAVELASIHFVSTDTSIRQLLAASLFSDGAAAVVVGPGAGVEVIAEDSVTWPGTEHVMGWHHDQHGRRLVLSSEVPVMVHNHLRASLKASAAQAGLCFDDIRHFVLHPGGAAVLDAMEDVLDLDRGALVESRSVLRDAGNMSSVTVLSILERWIEGGAGAPGELGVLSAMGPGFRVRHVFIRC